MFAACARAAGCLPWLRWVAFALLTVGSTACLGDGRPLAEYAKQIEAYRAGLAAADASAADALADGGTADTTPVDGAGLDSATLDSAGLDSAGLDSAGLDAVADTAKEVASSPDIMRWAGDGYVKPPGDPTCAVIETTGICSDQTGLPTIKVTLNFHNTCTSKTLRLIWYDADCKAHPYGEVGPGQWLTQQTYLGHAWRIVDAATGELIAEHLVTTFQGGEVNLP